jgi:hypothetical protein
MIEGDEEKSDIELHLPKEISMMAFDEGELCKY